MAGYVVERQVRDPKRGPLDGERRAHGGGRAGTGIDLDRDAHVRALFDPLGELLERGHEAQGVERHGMSILDQRVDVVEDGAQGRYEALGRSALLGLLERALDRRHHVRMEVGGDPGPFVGGSPVGAGPAGGELIEQDGEPPPPRRGAPVR
jgi:hypothetical protein